MSAIVAVLNLIVTYGEMAINLIKEILLFIPKQGVRMLTPTPEPTNKKVKIKKKK